MSTEENVYCPYCQKVTSAPFEDITGYGLQQAGPYGCGFCGATEIGPYDCTCDSFKREHSLDTERHEPWCYLGDVDPRAVELGWYEPNKTWVNDP